MPQKKNNLMAKQTLPNPCCPAGGKSVTSPESSPGIQGASVYSLFVNLGYLNSAHS